MRITRLFGSLAVLFALALTSCEHSSTTELPTDVSKQEATAQSSSVYWSSNRLNFSYGGDSWRVERDQQQARRLKIYRNGTRVGDMVLTWSGGRIVKRRFINVGGEWTEFAEDGRYLGSSIDQAAAQSGMVSALGGGPDEPCHEIYQEFLESGDIAVVSGVVSIITGGAGTPIGLIAGGVFVVESTKAFGKMTSWIRCRIRNSHGGGSDGSEGEGGKGECPPDKPPEYCDA